MRQAARNRLSATAGETRPAAATTLRDHVL